MVDDAAAGVAGSADDAGTAVAGVADEATAGVAGFADDAAGTAPSSAAPNPKATNTQSSFPQVVDVWSRQPKSLLDEMTLEAAKNGAGKRIIASLHDPKFLGMEKWSYAVKTAKGILSEVHYVRNPKTGELLDFKFKHHGVEQFPSKK